MSLEAVADLKLRPAAIDDAEAVADAATALRPDDPMDPLVLRHHWFAPEPSETVERFAVLARRGVVGLCTQRHDDWARMATRYGGVQVILHPDVRTDANLTWAFDRIEERSRQDGTEVLRTWGREDDVQLFDLLARRGYSVDRRLRYWELDLVANRRRLMEMAAASRTRMAAQRVLLLTLAQDQDPERFRQLHELDEEGDQDVPSTVPHLPKSFDVFMKWFDEPGLHLDRLWIAREADRVVGLSVLSYPPIRGHVSTEWTTTLRAVRGRGIARALKLETVAQAIDLGIARVRTDNDSENAPILHLNEQMGYHRITGAVSLLKPA
ncbi:MAG TPA: GNAT family N-acetyltransferase [Candidatus Dormibacteraeota bacterium]|nr:GNAT family N-acetyltransferase [Candidatus Dormibacteraeota bacterium]